ncbi:MAG: lytic transglycosylase domain-containing protein [Rhodospirillales bacterium]|nr:lytic transglycosylase domain-containing protein [Rhodospirillales bacterium]
MAAWRSENYDEASLYFESVARSDRANPWLVAGGAFWAARANLFAQRPSEVSAWLAVAADCTETFYGLLARRILGLPMPFQWDLTEEDEAALAAFNQSEDGQRALALMQQSRQAQAEQLLMGIAARGRPDVAHGAMIVAENSGMADLAFRLQRRLKAYGVQYAGAQYPIPSWVPDGGFSTDRALIYALMRQESSFNPRAVSRAGARGLMQLMPATARFVARSTGLSATKPRELSSPEVNLMLGQRYLELLLADENVGNDLFRLAAAWNGGPGNLERWQREPQAFSDPLLFIESIPYAETRGFIEHVLANLWIYRHRLHQSSPSLDSLAAGRWPSYDGIDTTPVEIAEHAAGE